MPKNSSAHIGILSGKVILRSMAWEDLPVLFSWMQDSWLLSAINRTRKTTWPSHLAWYNKIQHDKQQIIFSIVLKRSGRLLGQCGLKNIDHENKKAELWIFLGEKKMQGRGYGKNALQGLLRYAFMEAALNRIYLYAIDSNEKAVQFYKGLGFVQEGIFRQDVMICSSFHDTIHLSILKQDYLKLHTL